MVFAKLVTSRVGKSGFWRSGSGTHSESATVPYKSKRELQDVRG